LASASLPPAPRAVPLPRAVPPPLHTGTVFDRGVARRAEVAAAEWTVRGTAKVTGNVAADTITVDGTASVGGKLTAAELTVDGRLDVVGDAAANHRLAVVGAARFGGALHAGDVDVRGTLRVEGPVDVDRSVLWRGSLELAHGLTASRFAGEGRVDAKGVVQAKDVDLGIDGPSSIGSIQAETVRVRSRRKLLGESPSLEVERIDADIVELEDVHVEFVRASQIVAGPGTRIARHEGRVTRQHASARIGPSSVSVPPYGLSR
jgi:cytoskeletal protein CcmA (bactofilin family)